MTEIVSKDALQKRDSRPLVEHSSFDNSYRVAGTYRFGEYAPTLCIPVIPNDKHGVRVNHKLRSYTMKQPLLQGIQLKEDTFLVPYSALLPRNYEKVFLTPNIGDDVDASEVGTTVVGFSGKIYYILSSVYDTIIYAIQDEDPSTDILEILFKYTILVDTLYSSGSLFNAFGCPLSSKSKFADNIVNSVFSTFDSLGTDNFNLRVKIGDEFYEIGRDPITIGDNGLSFREFLNRIHDVGSWSVVRFTDVDGIFEGFINDFFVSTSSPYYGTLSVTNFVHPDYEAPIDLSPFQAYQISCAHFYSNDKVDYIYSAELWRQSLRTLLSDFLSSFGFVDFNRETFSYNGITCFYDECSAHAFNGVYFGLKSGDVQFLGDLPCLGAVCDYIFYLFSYRRSLRYVDYTTGSRTRPLAVGDANVSVVNDKVNVVDTIQTKWYIRLWSQISRVGHKLSEQMQGLFPGVQISVDWHDPIWIKGTDPRGNNSVFATEVDNTGDNQFDSGTPIAITSNINSSIDSGYLDLTVNDRYGVLISICYFDISRFYFKGVDRHFFNVDRFDRFNPFIQFNGDQKVYMKELDSDSDFVNVFAYQGRYEEMKTRLDRAFGGFINESLPGMVFLADENRDRWSHRSLSPDYIRSYQCELDNYFISLSGYSLGTYFHFIMLTDNEIDSNRPMAYNPQIQ